MIRLKYLECFELSIVKLEYFFVLILSLIYQIGL